MRKQPTKLESEFHQRGLRARFCINTKHAETIQELPIIITHQNRPEILLDRRVPEWIATIYGAGPGGTCRTNRTLNYCIIAPLVDKTKTTLHVLHQNRPPDADTFFEDGSLKWARHLP